MNSLGTFAQGVAKNFKEIFEALAPGGTGQLVMLKRGLPDAEPPEDEEDGAAAAPPPASERYKGVKVKVRRRAGPCDSFVCTGLGLTKKALVMSSTVSV